MKNIFTDRAIVLIDQAIFSGTSFLTTLLIAQMLPMEVFGVYSAYLLGIYLVMMGIGAFVILPFQVWVMQKKDTKEYTIFAFWFQLTSVLIIMFLFFILNGFFHLNLPVSFVVFGAGFIIHDFGRRMFLALNQLKSALYLDLISCFGLVIGMYFFSISDYKDLNSLFAYLIPAYSVSFFWLIKIVQPKFLNKRVLIESFVLHVKEGKWLFFTAIIQWWSSNLFVVASGIYLGAAALGALRLAQSLMGVLNVLLQSFENYILPQTASKINIDLKQGIYYLVNISKKAGLVFLPVLLLIIFFSKPILVLAGGADYESYAFVLQGMALLYVLVFISQPIRLLVRAMILNQHFFYGYLFSLLFALIFSHYLLSNFALLGALIGLAGSQMLLIIYWSFILKSKNIQLWKSFILY